MKIPSKAKLSKKTMAIVLIVALAVLLLAVVGVFVWGLVTRDAYKKDMQARAQTVQQAIRDAQESLKAEEKETPRAKLMQALAEELREQANQLSPPHILGVNVVSSEATAASKELKTQLQHTADQLQAAWQMLEYQQKMAAILRTAENKTGHTAQEQTALAQAWQVIADDLTKVTPPTAYQTTHQKTVDAARSIHATLTALPELTTKKDVAAFKTKQDELGSRFVAMRALATEAHEIAIAQDRLLREEINTLQELLGRNKNAGASP